MSVLKAGEGGFCGRSSDRQLGDHDSSAWLGLLVPGCFCSKLFALLRSVRQGYGWTHAVVYGMYLCGPPSNHVSCVPTPPGEANVETRILVTYLLTVTIPTCKVLLPDRPCVSSPKPWCHSNLAPPPPVARRKALGPPSSGTASQPSSQSRSSRDRCFRVGARQRDTEAAATSSLPTGIENAIAHR